MQNDLLLEIRFDGNCFYDCCIDRDIYSIPIWIEETLVHFIEYLCGYSECFVEPVSAISQPLCFYVQRESVDLQSITYPQLILAVILCIYWLSLSILKYLIISLSMIDYAIIMVGTLIAIPTAFLIQKASLAFPLSIMKDIMILNYFDLILIILFLKLFSIFTRFQGLITFPLHQQFVDDIFIDLLIYFPTLSFRLLIWNIIDDVDEEPTAQCISFLASIIFRTFPTRFLKVFIYLLLLVLLFFIHFEY